MTDTYSERLPWRGLDLVSFDHPGELYPTRGFVSYTTMAYVKKPINFVLHALSKTPQDGQERLWLSTVGGKDNTVRGFSEPWKALEAAWEAHLAMGGSCPFTERLRAAG